MNAEDHYQVEVIDKDENYDDEIGISDCSVKDGCATCQMFIDGQWYWTGTICIAPDDSQACIPQSQQTNWMPKDAAAINRLLGMYRLNSPQPIVTAGAMIPNLMEISKAVINKQTWKPYTIKAGGVLDGMIEV